MLLCWEGDCAAPGVLLGWVLRSDDCLTCSSLEAVVRRLQNEFGPHAFDLVAVRVGDGADDGSLSRHFAEARLDPHSRLLSVAHYERALGGNDVPRLYLIDDGRVLDAADRAKEASRLLGRLRGALANSEPRG